MACSRIAFVLLLTGAYSQTVLPDISNKNYTYQEGDRYFYMPDGDGNLQLVDSQETTDKEYSDKLGNLEDWASYYLYTRRHRNAPQTLRTDDYESVEHSFFDRTKDTKVIVHGWRSNGKNHRDITKDAFLTADDVNVIIVDWETVASGPYLLASSNVPAVGHSVAKFLRFLFDADMFDTGLHLVGHSLGAHVVGFAGRVLEGRVPRITGLDPALPLWGILSRRIQNTDANYVEIIHTNAGIAGQIQALGDVDFYPNGGTWMKGCRITDIGCSHGRAYEYFAESVMNDSFLGVGCNTVDQAKLGICNRENTLMMGNMLLDKSDRGIFYLKTNADRPFGRGWEDIGPAALNK